MSTRQRLSFKQKAAILEEISRPNFSKEKILRDFQISKTCFYKILKEKDSILRVSSEKSKTSNETVTTSEFLKHLSSVRTYIQSRGASENIHNSLHDLERIGIQDQIENSGKKQTKITTFLSSMNEYVLFYILIGE